MVPPHSIPRLQHEEHLRQYFNQSLASGQAVRMETWHRPVTEKLLDRMDIGAQDRTLEIGCGEGWATRLIAERSPEGAVVGIDLADDLIASARAKSIDYQNILFAPGSAEEIPWAEDYFTRVISVETAYYWHSPEQAVREVFRATAWGGRVFLLMFYYAENPHSHHWKQHAPAEIHLRSADEWREVFSLLGFENVEHSRIRDDTPIPTDFEPDLHWRSREEKEAFNHEGALLISARKPPMPEPGPLTSEPNPLRILT